MYLEANLPKWTSSNLEDEGQFDTEHVWRTERGEDIHDTVGLRDTEKPDCGRNDQDDRRQVGS